MYSFAFKMAVQDDSANFYVNGQVVCAGRNACHIEHLDLPDAEQLPPIQNKVREAMANMSSLQASRGARVTSGAMQVAVDKIWDSLPRDLGCRVLCDVTRPRRGLWTTDNWGNTAWLDQCRAELGWMRNLSGYAYVVMAFCVDSAHWMVAVIHLIDDGKQVAQLALFDPATDQEATSRGRTIRNQLVAILRDVGKLTFSTDYWRNVWVPEKENPLDSSDGPRVYWICRETMRRLLDIYETGEWYHESLWNDHSGWFQEDTARHEIISAQAWSLVSGMDYRGRLAVEAVNGVRTDVNGEWETPTILKPPRKRDDRATLPRSSVKPKKAPLQAFERTPRKTEGPTPLNELGLRLVPPRSQPKIYPTFSMVKGDGLFEYDGWDDPKGRGPAWNDPPRVGPRPAPRQPPQNPILSGVVSLPKTPGRFGNLGGTPGTLFEGHRLSRSSR